MVKPIGNLSANLKTNDKVSHRVKTKFGGKAQPAPAEPGEEGKEKELPGSRPAKTPPKFKTRKR